MSSSKSEGLNREKAILLTAAGRKIGEICQMIGICKPTYRRMADDPEFQKEVEHQRKMLMREYKTRTLTLVPVAFATLKRVMKGPNHSAAIRAAMAVLATVGALGEPEKALDTTKKILQLSFVPKKSTGTDE